MVPGCVWASSPEAKDMAAGVRRHGDLWLAVLPDPNGFMGLFNDAYECVAEAVFTLGRHDRGNYFYKPTPMGQRLQAQLEKYGSVRSSKSITRSMRPLNRTSSALRHGSCRWMRRRGCISMLFGLLSSRPSPSLSHWTSSSAWLAEFCSEMLDQRRAQLVPTGRTCSAWDGDRVRWQPRAGGEQLLEH